MKWGFKTFILLFIPGLVFSQELNCNVEINSERIQTSDRLIFEDMERSFEDFLNNKKWTSDQFNVEERINCNLLITMDRNPSVGNFEATVQIQAARPIYNSNYETILLNFADRDWVFQYFESQPLQFADNLINDNLTAMLAFYAYIILTLDYDSFSPEGGTEYLEKAWNIIQNAQQSGASGWQQFESNRNRYWLAENLLSPQLKDIRELNYNYHRLALDEFIDKPDEARKVILEGLKKIQAMNKARPNSVIIISFFDAKSDELARIFSQGNMAIRRQAYDIAVELDPTQAEKYKSMIEN
jgi:hypothetical protein